MPLGNAWCAVKCLFRASCISDGMVIVAPSSRVRRVSAGVCFRFSPMDWRILRICCVSSWAWRACVLVVILFLISARALPWSIRMRLSRRLSKALPVTLVVVHVSICLGSIAARMMAVGGRSWSSDERSSAAVVRSHLQIPLRTMLYKYASVTRGCRWPDLVKSFRLRYKLM